MTSFRWVRFFFVLVVARAGADARAERIGQPTNRAHAACKSYALVQTPPNRCGRHCSKQVLERVSANGVQRGKRRMIGQFQALG
jgi:hypothetical protein